MFEVMTFLKESNAIEGIVTTKHEEHVHVQKFLSFKAVTSYDLEQYVALVSLDARLRSLPGMDVTVGGYTPPMGGTRVAVQLSELMTSVNLHPDQYHTHHLQYERIHPFTDGNGRSGRLLWLWARLRCNAPPIHGLFLQQFYYDTLRHYHG